MFRQILTGAQKTVLESLSRIASLWRISIADPDDVAAMKLSAIAGGGSRKDFVDLYAYARNVAPLPHALACFREKFRGIAVDPYHLLRSLTFFEDAEAEAMPDLVIAVTWEEVKDFFRAEAPRLFSEL